MIQKFLQYATESEEDILSHYVEENLALVKHIISHMEIHLPSGMDRQDLVSIGNMGLVDAARKYDPSRNVKFNTYAYIRVRGAILDEVRRFSFGGQAILRKQKKLMDAFIAVEQNLNRQPSDEEVAAYLELSLDKFEKLVEETSGVYLLSLDDFVEDDAGARLVDTLSNSEDHLEDAIHREQQEILSEAIEKLPEQESMVLSLYYEQELSLKEISLIMDLSESRISQIHKKAILHIKSSIGSLDD